MTRSLLIMDCDVLPRALAGKHGSYALMMRRALSAWPGCEVHSCNAVLGTLPPLDERFELVLVTGSKADAFADEPWLLRLLDWLEARIGQGQQLLGICFGHQLIARLHGARVARATQGWQLGALDYRREAVLPGLSLPATLRLLASHRDQVQSLPSGGQVWLRHESCPYAGLRYGKQILTMQPHPEFSSDYLAALLEKRRAEIGETAYRQALASLARSHQGPLLFSLLADWL
ncbi:amidotransferase [Gallaecimonas sp. GXIMD4217]|uniref:glutamine amidotransferase-related protein n=1 Tax=Gallaecimonas sp. GXIMD4217 TaxID=3131927 RepID=UPI00311AE13B